jgi:hypothetical protein
MLLGVHKDGSGDSPHSSQYHGYVLEMEMQHGSAMWLSSITALLGMD